MNNSLLSKLNKRNIIQLVKFVLVGFSNAIVLLIVYNIGLKLGLNYQIAYVIGFVISVLNAYFWNNRFVFKNSTATFFRKLIKVYASYIATYLLSALLLYVWTKIFGVPEEIAPLINIVITTPINFVLNKLWAFKNRKNNDKVVESENIEINTLSKENKY